MPRPRKYKRPPWPKFHVPDDIDSRTVRQQLGYTQERFAAMLGVSVRTIQAWERTTWERPKPGQPAMTGVWNYRHRRPTGAARVLLAMIRRDPWIVFDCLTGAITPARAPIRHNWMD